jgi:hypothetical protein
MRGLSTIPIGACDSLRGQGYRQGALLRPGDMRTDRRSRAPRRSIGTAARGAKPDPDLVEAIALRVVELIGDRARREALTGYIDASALARDLGVERDWVYSHAEALGAIRLGGPHGRLRFDREIVKERLGGIDAVDWKAPRRSPRRAGKRAQARMDQRAKSGGPPPRARVKSTDTQRRASGWTPARSPRQQHPGGSPE